MGYRLYFSLKLHYGGCNSGIDIIHINYQYGSSLFLPADKSTIGITCKCEMIFVWIITYMIKSEPEGGGLGVKKKNVC